jgi:hypothetical protein
MPLTSSDGRYVWHPHYKIQMPFSVTDANDIQLERFTSPPRFGSENEGRESPTDEFGKSLWEVSI